MRCGTNKNSSSGSILDLAHKKMFYSADVMGSKPGSQLLPFVVFDLASRVNIRSVCLLDRWLKAVAELNAEKTCPPKISNCKNFLKFWTAGPRAVHFKESDKLCDDIVVADVDHMDVAWFLKRADHVAVRWMEHYVYNCLSDCVIGLL